jgi:hypothetical protein
MTHRCGICRYWSFVAGTHDRLGIPFDCGQCDACAVGARLTGSDHEACEKYEEDDHAR